MFSFYFAFFIAVQTLPIKCASRGFIIRSAPVVILCIAAVLFSILSDFLSMRSSQEPDPKKLRTDDNTMAPMMPDMQTNHSGYNYNWYQVSFTQAVWRAFYIIIYVESKHL